MLTETMAEQKNACSHTSVWINSLIKCL